MLLPGSFGETRRVVVLLDRIAAWGAVVVGVAGMVLHLRSGFFETQTLHNLVYSAPFVAPLAYVGVGCLVLLVRSVDGDGPSFGTWILVLAFGGFLGNFALSLLDHAQNGFFSPIEWIPVAAAALAIGFLSVELARPGVMSSWFAMLVLALQVVVAVAGLALHATADLSHPTTTLLERLVFGAPVFAPMLFADLAVLVAIGLWARDRALVSTPVGS
jgi:hypothetical protein